MCQTKIPNGYQYQTIQTANSKYTSKRMSYVNCGEKNRHGKTELCETCTPNGIKNANWLQIGE